MQEESRLLNYLMANYDREVRPVYNASKAVVVRVGITLTQIFDMVSASIIKHEPFCIFCILFDFGQIIEKLQTFMWGRTL